MYRQRRATDQYAQTITDESVLQVLPLPVDQDQEDELDGPSDGAEVFSESVDETQLLTAQEEVQLAHMIQAGGPTAQVAQRRFLTANRGLVYRVARRYLGRGLDLEDLVQEGNIGLLRAIERFDPDRGCKFSTMAVWWIRQAIAIAIANTGTPIRHPAHHQTTLYRLKQAEAQFLEEIGRAPTDEELAEQLELSLEILRNLRETGSPLRSLSAPLGDGDDLDLGNTLADPSNLEEKTLAGLVSQEIQQVLKTVLSEREYEVVQGRFGLDGGEQEKLAKIGRDLGISRERVRQLEERALLKLRHVPQLAALYTES